MARAGLARIALGALGLAAALVMKAFAPYLWAYAAYVAIGCLFQWMILRSVFRTVTRTLCMGVVDVVFLTFLVQRMGSLSSQLPLVYVVAPVLYATTTARRRVALLVASLGIIAYGSTLVLEQLDVWAYAPGVPGLPRPDSATAVANFSLVAMSSLMTTALTTQLISALGVANAKLRDLSQHDELTGLYNRRYIIQRLEAELARIRRHPAAVTVAMVDLDGFKRVNDELGHDMGDAVLKAVATALLEATRRIDVVARYGGDEFVILLIASEPEGTRIAGVRILDQARDAARAACPQIPVSASIGTTMLHAGDDALDVIRRVDERLYAAKRAGGDRIESG